jgi:hypothetical protein
MNILLALIIGILIGMLWNKRKLKQMKLANCHLRNESDYYFMTGKLYYKTLHHDDQESTEASPEYQRLLKQFKDNQKNIQKTGTY